MNQSVCTLIWGTASITLQRPSGLFILRSSNADDRHVQNQIESYYLRDSTWGKSLRYSQKKKEEKPPPPLIWSLHMSYHIMPIISWSFYHTAGGEVPVRLNSLSYKFMDRWLRVRSQDLIEVFALPSKGRFQVHMPLKNSSNGLPGCEFQLLHQKSNKVVSIGIS